MNRPDAIYEGYCEVVPFTTKKVEVRVEDGEDDDGVFVRVHYQGIISSKIRYQIKHDNLEPS